MSEETMTMETFLTKTDEMQKELMKLNTELENKKALYKAFTKQHMGLADGENTDVLSLFKTIVKVYGFLNP